MMSIIKNISGKIIETAICTSTLMKNILAEHHSRKQVEYFKKLGCEVFEKDEKGKWRKI